MENEQRERERETRRERWSRKISSLFINTVYFLPPPSLINIRPVLCSPLDNRQIAFIQAAWKHRNKHYSLILMNSIFTSKAVRFKYTRSQVCFELLIHGYCTGVIHATDSKNKYFFYVPTEYFLCCLSQITSQVCDWAAVS